MAAVQILVEGIVHGCSQPAIRRFSARRNTQCWNRFKDLAAFFLSNMEPIQKDIWVGFICCLIGNRLSYEFLMNFFRLKEIRSAMI